MSRPPLEVADLIRTAGTAFIERNRQWIRWTHIKVLVAIARCRTAALGGHIDECTRCGHRATISYNSCRNRHCPKCQTGARQRWIQARRRELLPSPYVHVVFTLPPQLAALALQNKKIIYGLLLRASAETLLEVARNPSHLGAEIGFFSVLHTWNQKLQLHPHVHCVVPSGGLSLDHTRWIRSRPRFFLPIQVLRRVFRGKFVVGLKSAFQHGQLHFSGNLALLAQPKVFASWLRPLFRRDWVVYSKPPFPEYVLHYLAARGASLDSQRKRLRDSQRSSLQCAHGDGATRAAATTRGVLDRAHGATPDSARKYSQAGADSRGRTQSIAGNAAIAGPRHAPRSAGALGGRSADFVAVLDSDSGSHRTGKRIDAHALARLAHRNFYPAPGRLRKLLH